MNVSSCQRKVVVIGEQSVGKTCILQRLVDNTFDENSQPTISNSTFKYETNVNGKDITLTIWDTAGQEKYRSLTSVYFRDAQAAIIVFDALETEPIEQIKSWLSSFRSVVGNKGIVVVAANKADLVSDVAALKARCVDLESELEGIPVHVVSAKDGDGVSDLFNFVAEKVSEIKSEAPVIEIGPTKKKGCC